MCPQVVSKGLLLLAQSMDAVAGGTTTISVPVSADMSPSFRLVVMAVTRKGEIVTDAVWVPIEGISMHKVGIAEQLLSFKKRSSGTDRFHFFF